MHEIDPQFVQGIADRFGFANIATSGYNPRQKAQYVRNIVGRSTIEMNNKSFVIRKLLPYINLQQSGSWEHAWKPINIVRNINPPNVKINALCDLDSNRGESFDIKNVITRDEYGNSVGEPQPWVTEDAHGNVHIHMNVTRNNANQIVRESKDLRLQMITYRKLKDYLLMA